jgi:hypothetical protein
MEQSFYEAGSYSAGQDIIHPILYQGSLISVVFIKGKNYSLLLVKQSQISH